MNSNHPSIALLNKVPGDMLQLMKQLAYLMLLEAKITIAREWKSPSVTFRRLKHNVSWLMEHETVASINDKPGLSEQTWGPW